MDSKIQGRGWKVFSKTERYSKSWKPFVLQNILDTSCVQRLPWCRLWGGSPPGNLEPGEGWETDRLNSQGEFELRNWLAQLPKQERFPWQCQIIYPQVLAHKAKFSNKSEDSAAKKVCPQLIRLTASKSTNTSAPVPGQRFIPDQHSDNFLHVFFQDSSFCHNPFHLFVLIPSSLSDVQRHLRVWRGKGYVINFTFRILNSYSCEGRPFCSPRLLNCFCKGNLIWDR